MTDREKIDMISKLAAKSYVDGVTKSGKEFNEEKLEKLIGLATKIFPKYVPDYDAELEIKIKVLEIAEQEIDAELKKWEN